MKLYLPETQGFIPIHMDATVRKVFKNCPMLTLPAKTYQFHLRGKWNCQRLIFLKLSSSLPSFPSFFPSFNGLSTIESMLLTQLFFFSCFILDIYVLIYLSHIWKIRLSFDDFLRWLEYSISFCSRVCTMCKLFFFQIMTPDTLILILFRTFEKMN